MMDGRIVRRYAAALFNRAQAAGVVDAVESDLGLIAYSLETIPRLEQAMTSPLIPAAKKRAIVTSVFSGKIQEITLYYLYLLIDNRREGIAKETEAEYVRLANEARGIVTARVTSAVELSESELAALRAKLSGYTGQQVEVSAEVDPSLIGGIVVRIGDRVMDGSIAGHLQRIRDEFLGR